MSIIRRFTGRAVARAAALGVVVTVAACTEDSGPFAPDSNLPAAFAQDPFDGPKSVPTRGRIYVFSTATGDWEIYSMEEDGSDAVRLTYFPGFDGYPAVSLDGKKVAFARTTGGYLQIYSMNSDGSQIKKLTSLAAPFTAASPAWSPDGKKIAMTVFNGFGPGSIYIMNANGSNLTPLVASPGKNMHPTFSPDGKRVAFMSDRTGNWEIWSVDINGGTPTQMTSCVSKPCAYPKWSPDGTKLAYGGLTAGYEILDLNTHAVVAAIPGAASVAWAPDGLRLAYTFFDTNTFQVSVATASPYGTQVQVLGSLGWDTYASSWGQ